MKFEWKDRSENDLLVLTLASRFLCGKVTHIRHLILKHAERTQQSEYFCLDADSDGVYAVTELLQVDFEWIYDFMQRGRGDSALPYVGNTPTDVLPKGYSFELRHISSCDDATDARPCCVRPYVYVVKDA